MNIYAVIILGTLLLTTALEVWAELRNLRALSPVLPEEFRGVYDEKEYARSQEYTRVRTRFGFNHTTVKTFVLDMLTGGGALPGVLIGGPVLALVLWLFLTAGTIAWLYAWVAVTLFMIVMQYKLPSRLPKTKISHFII